jgi:hypothetical protein
MMHPETMSFVQARVFGREFDRVLEIGSQDVNGSVRRLFSKNTKYWGIDVVDGPGVDAVVDGATFETPHDFPGYSLVLCLEVLEHAPEWRAIVRTCAKVCSVYGECIITCATDPRPPHGGQDGRLLTPEEHHVLMPTEDKEYYRNVDPQMLLGVVHGVFKAVYIERLDRGDLRVIARHQ